MLHYDYIFPSIAFFPHEVLKAALSIELSTFRIVLVTSVHDTRCGILCSFFLESLLPSQARPPSHLFRFELPLGQMHSCHPGTSLHLLVLFLCFTGI